MPARAHPIYLTTQMIEGFTVIGIGSVLLCSILEENK